MEWMNLTNEDQRYVLQVALSGEDSCALYDLSLSVDPAAFGAAVCGGDGSGAACPCGNESEDPLTGCRNSTGLGARISVSGSNVVSANDAVFHLTQAVPNKTALLLQGQNAIAIPFKNGILCTGSPTQRLMVSPTNANGSSSSYGSIVDAAGLAPGMTRYYQWWYRSGLQSTCGMGSNFSGAVAVDWL